MLCERAPIEMTKIVWKSDFLHAFSLLKNVFLRLQQNNKKKKTSTFKPNFSQKFNLLVTTISLPDLNVQNSGSTTVFIYTSVHIYR